MAAILATAAALLCLTMQSTYAAAGQARAEVTVREEHGVYTVKARFLVAQTSSTVLAVLTDYEQIPRFMPHVRSSLVRERAAGRAVVEQEVESSALMFSKRVHLVLEIDEQQDAVVFRDRCGESFRQYAGAWRLSRQDGRTAVTYELTAEPSFDVPGFVLRRVLRRDSDRMIELLQREIVARSSLHRPLEKRQ
jgi:ribosome-associated toxin RatA of RatAB toxin-antitoxin module